MRGYVQCDTFLRVSHYFIFPMAEENQGRRRISNMRLLLTYKTHVDKEGLARFLRGLYSVPVKELFIAHENGESNSETPYEHSHVAIMWERRVQTKDMRKFDYEGIHPNIKPLQNIAAWRDAKKYIAKEDPSLSHLLEEEDHWTAPILRASTLQEAILTATKRPGDVLGVERSWKILKTSSITLATPRPVNTWTESLLEELQERCYQGHRKVIWIYDPKGNTGKTHLSNYLEDNFDQQWFCMSLTDGRSTHLLNQIIQAKTSANPWEGFGICFDIPRGFSRKTDWYGVLESVKNGRITSTMYQGGRMVIPTPHVLVLANFWPHTECLSKDRWDIREIVDGDLITRDTDYMKPDSFIDNLQIN